MSKVLNDAGIEALVAGVPQQPTPQLVNPHRPIATPQYTAFGLTHTLKEWAKRFGCLEQWLADRLKRYASVDPVLLLEGTLREYIRRSPRNGFDDLQGTTRYQIIRMVPVRLRPPTSPSEAQLLADLEEVFVVPQCIKNTVATLDEWEVLLGIPHQSLRGPVWYARAFHPTLPQR